MNNLWLRFQGSTADIVAHLFQMLPGGDLWKLIAVSALLGIVLIFLYRYVSFQNTLKVLKKKILAIALEPFLFSDSTRISLGSPIKMFGLAFSYLMISIPPLLILGAPVLWILGFLNQNLGYSHSLPHQQLAVSIEGATPRSIRELQLSVDGADIALLPAVRSFKEAKAWAALIPSNGAAKSLLKVQSGAESVEIPVEGPARLPVLSNQAWERMLFPGANLKLPKDIQKISIEYPTRYFEIFGFSVSWIVLFLIVSMVFGLVFAKLFKIQV